MSATSGIAENGAVELHWTLDEAPQQETAHRLLLINGLGSPLVSFEQDYVEAFVERGCSVARFDNRDVGRSSRVPNAQGQPRADHPYTLTDMALDTVAVLDDLGWSTAHVLGQSMGGMIAQQVAIEHPSRVQSLIALMTASGERGYGGATKEALTALMQASPGEPDAWLEHRVATERIWASPDHWSEEWVRSKGRAMIDRGIDPQGAARQFRAVMAAGSRDQALAALDVPTLVIHGSADTLIKPDGGRHLAEVIPGARYLEVEGLGHDLPPTLRLQIIEPIATHLELTGELDLR